MADSSAPAMSAAFVKVSRKVHGDALRDQACAYAVERAFASHFSGNALHRAAADAALSSNLQNALAGPQLTLDSLFQGPIDPRLPSCVPASTALLSPAWTRWRIMLRSNSAKAPVT
jgi:hypothetical protein